MKHRAWKVAGATGAVVLTMALYGVGVADEPPAGGAPGDSVGAASADTAAAAPADTAAAAKAATKAVHQYVGVKKCKICHTSEKGGAQYKKWLESKH
ncbi:MAG: hypothetical protein HY553_00045, partial [Elusimicrobia bacterium]|nr:hypothetical protein [Elusimicrobiota bacterium]